TLNPANGFKIYRSQEQEFSLSIENLKDSVEADQFSYIDTDVQNGQAYFYKITSINSEEESEPSNEIEITPKKGADLWLAENEIEVSLDTNQSQLEYLNLSNIGGIDLDFEIEIDLSIDDSIGGTDRFGYIWTDSRKKPESEFGWIDITNSGVLLNQNGTPDYIYGPIPLGFSFPFYGNNYDSLWIMLNGCLKFSPVRLLKWKNDILPNSQTPLSLIAPLWSNLWFEDSTKIYYYSSQDSFIVSYIQMKHFISGKYLTFQTILTQKGEIDFQYLEVEDPITSATIGMQNDDGSCGILISYNQEFLEDSLRVRIMLGWIQVEPRKGEIPTGDDLPLTLFLNSDFLDTGTYSGSLNINSQDKNHQLKPWDISLTFNVGVFQDTVSDTTETDTSTAVSGAEYKKVAGFSLQQNYPNPFNATTIIPFTVHGKQKTENGPIPTSLRIYNIHGALVRTLVDEKRTGGNYEVIWDGKNEKGEAVASGIYLYKLKAGDSSETKKMILLK
ncbi:MAG: FlgD immunoglobulin-like domain containing protein, partial [Candidatus Zixiibacteriota bacterium]